MPTSTTTVQDIWPGAQLTITYNGKGLVSQATLFVPNGYTGQIAVTVKDVTSEVQFVAPIPGRISLAVTPGGIIETLNGKLGMRWTRNISPAWDPDADGNGWGFGVAKTELT